MATSKEYIEFVCECMHDALGDSAYITYKKMFGEYALYINGKTIMLVCDNTPYIKKHKELENLMKNASCGFPYNGAKERYILDIENTNLLREIMPILIALS